MRAIFAILFSALLLIGQSALPAGEAFVQSQPQCERCACGGKCCVKQESPASAPQPATPTSSRALERFQLTLLSTTQIYLLSGSALPARSSSDLSAFQLKAVPLYEWNCAYLI